MDVFFLYSRIDQNLRFCNQFEDPRNSNQLKIEEFRDKTKKSTLINKNKTYFYLKIKNLNFLVYE